MDIPHPLPTDVEDVAWALSTAESLWKRDERADAVTWVRRAAQAAGEAEDDDRALGLARAAAELAELIEAKAAPPAAAASEEVLDEIELTEMDESSLRPLTVAPASPSTSPAPMDDDDDVVTSAPIVDTRMKASKAPPKPPPRKPPPPPPRGATPPAAPPVVAPAPPVAQADEAADLEPISLVPMSSSEPVLTDAPAPALVAEAPAVAEEEPMTGEEAVSLASDDFASLLPVDGASLSPPAPPAGITPHAGITPPAMAAGAGPEITESAPASTRSGVLQLPSRSRTAPGGFFTPPSEEMLPPSIRDALPPLLTDEPAPEPPAAPQVPPVAPDAAQASSDEPITRTRSQRPAAIEIEGDILEPAPARPATQRPAPKPSASPRPVGRVASPPAADPDHGEERAEARAPAPTRPASTPPPRPATLPPPARPASVPPPPPPRAPAPSVPPPPPPRAPAPSVPPPPPPRAAMPSVHPAPPRPPPPPKHATPSKSPPAPPVAPKQAAPAAVVLPDGPVDLSTVAELADLPDDVRDELAAAASVSNLQPGDERAGFALAYVIAGSVDLSIAPSGAAGARLSAGTLLRAKTSIENVVPLRLVVDEGQAARVATWDDATVTKALADCPWVEDELCAASDRYHALAGATAGALGTRLDPGLRQELTQSLQTRALAEGEIVAVAGESPPGILVVAVGILELVADDRVVGKVKAGEFLFPLEVLGGAKARHTARAGKGGALVLSGEAKRTHELVVTYPSLLEILAGM